MEHQILCTRGALVSAVGLEFGYGEPFSAAGASQLCNAGMGLDSSGLVGSGETEFDGSDSDRFIRFPAIFQRGGGEDAELGPE
jgi:hypothetical protein